MTGCHKKFEKCLRGKKILVYFTCSQATEHHRIV